jgi:hypothetical protein
VELLAISMIPLAKNEAHAPVNSDSKVNSTLNQSPFYEQIARYPCMEYIKRGYTAVVIKSTKMMVSAKREREQNMRDAQPLTQETSFQEQGRC